MSSRYVCSEGLIMFMQLSRYHQISSLSFNSFFPFIFLQFDHIVSNTCHLIVVTYIGDDDKHKYNERSSIALFSLT